MNADQIWAEVVRGTSEILVEDDLRARLTEGKPLRIKLGMDPSSADLHLGHAVIMNKLRLFQDLGHEVLFLVGNFTARVGDPTGKNVTRPTLTAEQVNENAKTYCDQAFKILDPAKTQVLYNADWLDAMSVTEFLELASLQTVARMLERDDFSKRFRDNQPIAIHEFMYPLLQGYDSVAMKADLELGGNDQKFNLLMGRECQRHWGQRPQCILTMPLLVGLDGQKKMSKSLNNAIGITDSPVDMFGKLMSVSDELMWHYFELLSRLSLEEIADLKEQVSSGVNPRDIKVKLAKEMVERFHSGEDAQLAHQAFIDRFRHGHIPEDLEEQTLTCEGDGLGLAYILKQAGLVNSTSEAFRMIKQGAVKIDGERVNDGQVEIGQGKSHVFQVGKRRVAKVKVMAS